MIALGGVGLLVVGVFAGRWSKRVVAVLVLGCGLSAPAYAGPVPCEAQAGARKSVLPCPCADGKCVCYPCKCGPNGDPTCPCGKECCPRPAANADPYRAKSWFDFYARVNRVGGRGVLYIGVPDGSVGVYELHYRIPSGDIPGVADGVYDCWHDPVKCEPVMELRKPPPAPLPQTAEQWYWHLAPPGGYCPPTG
jgi:hypothetical protein